MVNITLSDLLFLVCVVPVLGLSFLRHDWWLGPTICTTGQATSNATTFCTFYGMVATAPLCHVAVIQPDTALSSGWGTCLLLCGATRFLGLTASSPHRLSRRVVVEAGGHRSLGLPLAPKPCSALLLLLPAWNPGLSALCAGAGLLFQSCGLAPVGTASWPHGESFQEHQENTELMLIVLEVFVLMWGPCSVLGYVAAMGGLSATPVASVAYRLHHPGLLQLCCQPHPLLLPFLLLPGRAQGPLL